MPQNKTYALEDNAGELVRRLRDREPEAIADLYDLYGRIVFLVIAREVRRPSIIEALVEETFLRAWNQVPELDPEAVAVGPWLMGIASRCAADYVRHSRASVPYLIYATFRNAACITHH